MVFRMKLKEIIEGMVKENDYKPLTEALYEGVFLDRFYNNPNPEDIADEPEENCNIPKYMYVRLAAIAETMAHKYGFGVPAWCMNEEKYKLSSDEPYFFLNADGDLKIILIVLSPPEFIWRNMFVMDNTLSRC